MKKVLIVGEVNTGKTSLVNRAVNDSFQSQYKATVAWEFGTKILEIGGQSVQLQLWDIAGQDRLVSSMTKIYCRDAAGALVVCDLTDRRTLDKTAEWRQQLQEHVPSGELFPIWLVCNKSDLPHAFTQEDIEAHVTQNGFYGSTVASAKRGENVEEWLYALATSMLYNSRKPSNVVKTVHESFALQRNTHGEKTEAGQKKKSCC